MRAVAADVADAAVVAAFVVFRRDDAVTLAVPPPGRVGLPDGRRMAAGDGDAGDQAAEHAMADDQLGRLARVRADRVMGGRGQRHQHGAFAETSRPPASPWPRRRRRARRRRRTGRAPRGSNWRPARTPARRSGGRSPGPPRRSGRSTRSREPADSRNPERAAWHPTTAVFRCRWRCLSIPSRRRHPPARGRSGRAARAPADAGPEG